MIVVGGKTTFAEEVFGGSPLEPIAATLGNKNIALAIAAVMAIIMLLQNPVKAYLKKEPIGPAFKQSIIQIFSSLATGARNMCSVALATAAAGIIVGVVAMGLGGLITEVIDVLSGGRLLFGESSTGDVWLVPLDPAGGPPRAVTRIAFNYDAVAAGPYRGAEGGGVIDAHVGHVALEHGV